MVLPLVKKGGFIISDNVLWSGKVTQPIDARDKETKILVELAELIDADNSVENVLMPIRDGLLVARKK